MSSAAEQLAALAANRYGPPIPLSPDGRAWDAVVNQLATAAQREAVLTLDSSGVGIYGNPLQCPAYGPNLTICGIDSECDSWQIAFNEPRNWQTISPGQSWVGQIFSRIFIQSAENPAVEPSPGDSIRISYGSAFLLNPVATLSLPQVSVRQSVSHYTSGALVLPSNPKRLKAELVGCPIASGSGGSCDVCAFAESLTEAEDLASFARLQTTNFGYPFKSYPLATAGGGGGSPDDVETIPSRFFPSSVMFWDSSSGPVTKQTSSGFLLNITMEGTGDIYMKALDPLSASFNPFSTTPGFLLIREFIQA